MIALAEPDFPCTFAALKFLMMKAQPVVTERWQGIEANTATRELRNVNFEVPLWLPPEVEQVQEDLQHWANEIRPNLPWADDHFAERVGGEPLNPGVQWAKWPWGQSARQFQAGMKFNHTYMERLWPKFARRSADGKLPYPGRVGPRKYDTDPRPKRGIAYDYGDLWSLVELLAKEPYTRQAWIPLFFPEDTGISDGGRKVCTLGYQVLVRNSSAHIWYPLRSCDMVRHFRDDVYLAVRLLLWIIQECRKLNPKQWDQITPGTYAMHMTSLHIFETDREKFDELFTI